MIVDMKPLRLTIAQNFCRALPPILALRARAFVYPYSRAQKDDFEYTAVSPTGARLRGTTRDYHFYPFGIQGYYEWRNVAIAQAVTESGDAIVEIGANIGTETVIFANMVGAHGKVYAFEPLPSNVEKLRSAIDLNDGNIVLYDCALSDKSENLQFVVPPEFSTGTGHLAHGGKTKSETVEVRCLPLDSLIEKIGRTQIIFMDVEGEEVNVLRGALEFIRKYEPQIVLEASPKLLKRAGTNLEELYETLRRLDYTVYKICRFGIEKVEFSALDTTRKASNWLCLNAQSPELVEKIRRHLLKCAVLPFLFGLNPLSRAGKKF